MFEQMDNDRPQDAWHREGLKDGYHDRTGGRGPADRPQVPTEFLEDYHDGVADGQTARRNDLEDGHFDGTRFLGGKAMTTDFADGIHVEPYGHTGQAFRITIGRSIHNYRCQSQRRYLLVDVGRRYTIKRSDNPATVQTQLRLLRQNDPSRSLIIIDTATQKRAA